MLLCLAVGSEEGDRNRSRPATAQHGHPRLLSRRILGWYASLSLFPATFPPYLKTILNLPSCSTYMSIASPDTYVEYIYIYIYALFFFLTEKTVSARTPFDSTAPYAQVSMQQATQMQLKKKSAAGAVRPHPQKSDRRRRRRRKPLPVPRCTKTPRQTERSPSNLSHPRRPQCRRDEDPPGILHFAPPQKMQCNYN